MIRTHRYFFKFLFLTIFSSFFSLSSFALINGEKLSGYSDLVRIDFKNGNMCTGFFVDPFTIVLAAHCLMDNDPIIKIVADNNETVNVEVIKQKTHPEFTHSFWPSRDVGIIKTTKYATFRSNFKLGNSELPSSGEAILYGCGISNFEPKERVRSFGKNNYHQFGSILLFFGNPKIAPNDSGAPVEDTQMNVIAMAVKTGFGVGVAVSLVESGNFEFIKKNRGNMTEEGIKGILEKK